MASQMTARAARTRARRDRLFALALGAAMVPAGLSEAAAVTRTWTNGAGNSAWSTATNWSGTPTAEPASIDPVIFPSSVPLSQFFITLSSGENASSLTLNNFYHLQGGSLTVATGSINTASGFSSFITSVLAGSSGLTVGGGGTLNLSGINTFTGTVTVSSGSTLSIDADTRLGNFTNPVTLNGGQLIIGTSTSTARLFTMGASGGSIQQVGGTTVNLVTGFAANGNALTVNGFGTLGLTASSSRTGSTSIQNGIVRLSNNAALGSGTVTVSSSGTFDLAAGAIYSAPLSLQNTGTLRGSSSPITYTGAITAAASAPSLTLNTSLVISDLTLTNYTGGSGSTTHVTGLGAVALGGANSYSGSWAIDSGTLRLTHADAITSATSPIAINSGGTVAAEVASNYPGAWNVGGVLRVLNAIGLGVGASAVNANIGGTLQIEGVNVTRAIALNGGGTVKGTGAATASGTVTAATAAPLMTLATGATSTDTLTVNNYTGGTGSTTHIGGSGTVILPNASTYAGGWEIDSGALRVDHASALGTSSFPVLVDGGTLQIHGGVTLTRDIAMNNGSTLRGGPLDASFNDAFALGTVSIASGAQVNFAGTSDDCELVIGNAFNGALNGGGGGSNITISAGMVRLGCPSTYSGGWIINGAFLVVGNDNQLGNAANAMTFAGTSAELDVSGPVTTSRQFNLNSSSNRINVGGDTLTINSGLAGSAGNQLRVFNPGTLVLNAAGTWDGTLATIGPLATVKVNHSAALGTTPLSVDNATLELGSGVALGQSLQLNHLGVLRGNNNAAYNGTINVVDAGSNDDVTLATVGPGDVFTIGNGVNDLTGGGSGSTITAAGPGTIVLSQTNNYTGDWIVSGGTLQIGPGDPLGNVSVVTVNNGATLALANAFVTDSACLLNNGGTLRAIGLPGIAGSDHLRIANSATDVFISIPGVIDALGVSAAVRNDVDGANSAIVHLSGLGRLHLQSGGTSALDIFSGSWEQSGGVLQVGNGSGSTINALGFKNGDAKQANTITINGGTLAVSAIGSGANTPPWLRANVILNGGAIAAMGAIDPQYGGDLVVSPNSTSKVLLFDLADIDAARNISLVAGAAGIDNLAGATNWGANSTLIVDPGTTTSGIFNIARTGGTITVGANATLQINAGATVTLGGTADALSDGANHVNVVKDAGAAFGVVQGSKNIGSLSGGGGTAILGGASLTVHQDVNTSTSSISGFGSFVKQGSGTLSSTFVDVGSLTINAGGLAALSVIDNGTINVNAGAMTADLLAIGNDGTLTGGSGTGTATISGGTVSAKKVLLGSSAGGNGTLRVQAGGTLATEKLAANALIVNGGDVTISAPAVPDDPVIDGSLVAGYVHDGSMNLNFGTITTPKLKLGVTAGKTGTITLNGGALNVTTLGVGNDGTATGGAGIGFANINGGQVNAASILIGSSAGGVGEMTLGSSGPDKVLKTVTLSIASGPGNKLDLTENKLIVTNGAIGTAGGGGTYDGLSGLIQSAYDFGAWDGPGITTSMADANAGLTTIAVSIGAQMRGLQPGDTDTFAGETITASSIVAMYTYAGDANLDGTIDGGDYGIIDNFVQVPGADGYANGDFNYDGVIDGGDYGIIDNNIQAQGAPFPTSSASSLPLTAVPEPSATVALAALIADVSMRRRRRRRR